MEAPKDEDRTLYRTQHTHAYFLLRAVEHSVSYVHFIQCNCVGSRLESSSQHVSRVFKKKKTLRLLHIHSSIPCLVATSWACLSVVLLFLTDWRRNQGSPASIPAAVAGLAEWPNSPRSQKKIQDARRLRRIMHGNQMRSDPEVAEKVFFSSMMRQDTREVPSL